MRPFFLRGPFFCEAFFLSLITQLNSQLNSTQSNSTQNHHFHQKIDTPQAKPSLFTSSPPSSPSSSAFHPTMILLPPPLLDPSLDPRDCPEMVFSRRECPKSCPCHLLHPYEVSTSPMTPMSPKVVVSHRECRKSARKHPGAKTLHPELGCGRFRVTPWAKRRFLSPTMLTAISPKIAPGGRFLRILQNAQK